MLTRVIALLTTTLLLASTRLANAQPLPPPTQKDLKPPHPWTYLVMESLALLAAVVLVAVALGYLVKARDFRANQRRGGAK